MSRSDVYRDMDEYARWMRRRDEIIRAALASGLPMYHIAERMHVGRRIVRMIKNTGHSTRKAA